MRSEFKKKSSIAFENKRYADRKYDGKTMAFTTSMDPSSMSMKYPVEYHIVSGRHTPRVDVHYTGNVTDASNIAGIASLYRDGPLYKSFDAATIPLGMHYRGLAMSEGAVASMATNRNYNAHFARSCITALSAAFATQLTEINYLKATVTTDIPEMTSGDEAKIGGLVGYEAIIQNVKAIIAAYNTLLSYTDRLVAMGYNAEATATMSLMNLFKKANVYSVMEQIANVLYESFYDEDWANEVGAICNIPTRSFDDMLSAMKGVIGYTMVPTFSIKNEGAASPYFDMSSDTYNKIHVTLDTTVSSLSNRYFTFQSLMYHMLELLNPVRILKWARNYYFNTSDRDSLITPELYVNDFLYCARALLGVFSKFNSAMVDLKTLLMLLQDRTDLNEWVIGTKTVAPSRPREQADWMDYLLVDDIYRAYFTGGADIVIDETTKKWKITTLWDYEKGIPAFDYYEGGFAIAASVRRMPSAADNDTSTDPFFNFPVAFTPMPYMKVWEYNNNEWRQISMKRQGYAVARNGAWAYLDREEIRANQFDLYPGLARMNLTSAEVGTIAVPILEIQSLNPGNVMVSNAIRFMMNEFGCVGFLYKLNQNAAASKMTEVTPQLSPTVVGADSREFTDFSRMAEEYVQKKAILRIRGGDATMGFGLR